jgi:transcriptional regulator with XRE-family HTH domain
MSYATAHIASTLKNAREAKGLSQRALSKLAGVPQSHISKIENGAVDLRLSSLVELARVLDLELTFVPRKSVPAVRSIVRTGEAARTDVQRSTGTVSELKRLQSSIDAMKQAFGATTELAQIQRQLRDLQHLTIPMPELDRLREINRSVQALKELGNTDAIRKTLSEIQSLRNAIAHSTSRIRPIETVRPVYSLEEDDDGK